MHDATTRFFWYWPHAIISNLTVEFSNHVNIYVLIFGVNIQLTSGSPLVFLEFEMRLKWNVARVPSTPY